MANTANDLAKDVALELGVISPGAELEAEDLTDLKNRSRRIHAMLRVRPKICYWDEEDVPDEVYDPLTLYLASACGKLFGKSVRDDGMDEAQTRRARLAALVVAASPGYTGATAANEYI